MSSRMVTAELSCASDKDHLESIEDFTYMEKAQSITEILPQISNLLGILNKIPCALCPRLVLDGADVSLNTIQDAKRPL